MTVVDADENRRLILLTYAGSTAFHMVVLYLVLHTWLDLSSSWVWGAMLAAALFLTAIFLIGFLAARLPSPEERLIARLRYLFRLLSVLGLAFVATLSWIIHTPGWRGWLQAVAIFVCATLWGGFIGWMAYRNSLERELRKLREREARRQSPAGSR